MSVGLLMFNLNDHAGTLRNVQSLYRSVDEIVVVDSSSPDEYEMLTGLCRGYPVRIYRVLPLGFAEPLRPFGISKATSDYVLVLDADEEVAEPLRSDLRKLTDCDSYVVPRFEEQLRSYTYHLRLFRRRSVRYRGRSFDFPDVTGRIGWLGKSHRISHHVDYRNYFLDKSRAERYFTIENVERPFTWRYLRDSLEIRMRHRSLSSPFLNWIRPNLDAMLSGPMVRWTIEVECLRDVLLGKGIKAASFNRRYSLGKFRFLHSLREAERDRLLAIARDLQACGGLFEYLGLRDPSYLEKLTASFNWDLRGIEVYRRLLDYRFTHGRPPPSVPAPSTSRPAWGGELGRLQPC